MVSQIVLLYCAAYLAHFAFVGVTLATAAPFDVRVLAVQVGTFPLFRRGRFSLGVLPLNGFVRFLDTQQDGGPDEEPTAFDNQRRPVRVLLFLAGPVGILLLALALRGLAGWASFTRAFGQLILGAIDPMGRGADLAAGYLAFAGREGSLATMGVLAAKIAAANLLPFPALAGGRAVTELLRPHRSPAYERFVEGLWHVSIWLMLAFVGSWLFAFYTAFGR